MTEEEYYTFICEANRDHFSDPNETRPFYWISHCIPESLEIQLFKDEHNQDDQLKTCSHCGEEIECFFLNFHVQADIEGNIHYFHNRNQCHLAYLHLRQRWRENSFYKILNSKERL